MRPSEAKARYSSGEKEITRRIVLAAATSINAETALDLWGGGGSARAILAGLPDIALVSAETDPALWPAQALDAQTHGYVAHQGDLRSVRGRFDLIWLDLCSQWSGSARELVVAASKLLADRGLLAVTLLAARESPEVAADRLYIVPRSLERIVNGAVQLLWSYQTSSPMWLVILQRGAWSRWDDTPRQFSRFPSERILDPDGSSYLDLAAEFRTQGFVATGMGHDWIEDYRDWLPVTPITPEPTKRVLKMSELSPEKQRIVRAFVDMAS